MAYRSYGRQPGRPTHTLRFLALALSLLVLIGGIYWFVIRNPGGGENHSTQTPSQPTEETEAAPVYVTPDLQPTIDEWGSKYAARYHIAIYDLQADEMIGSHQADTPLFAASLYKLYVAYLSYKDFGSGAQDPSEVILAGQTRLECADKMIRSSDSPCGETFMADIGQQRLTQRVQDEIATTSTIFNGIETSAADSIEVLKRIAAKEGLTEEYYHQLLDSMLTQEPKFKRGLAAGAPGATWYTKVGWNEDINYHDVGIMVMPDSRKFAVAILAQGSGSPTPIADFARVIYRALAANEHAQAP